MSGSPTKSLNRSLPSWMGHPIPPFPIGKEPKAPKWLQPLAKVLWRKLVKELVQLQILTLVDLPALEQVCQAYAHWRQADEDLVKLDSRVQSSAAGYIMQRPEINSANNFAMLYQKSAALFGFTPISRIRMAMPVGTGEEDPWGVLLKKAKAPNK